MEDAEVETTAVATVITPEHESITDRFMQRVIQTLKTKTLKIENYAVQDSRYSCTEGITVVIDEKTSLSISLVRAK